MIQKILVLTLALSTWVLARSVEVTSPPNIIVILTDDQGYGPMGCHGNTWIKTPNLDALHKTSVRFTSFHVSPTCSPTRSALLTGRDPLKNGVTHTINERDRLALQATTLPQVLKTVGYTSGIFGKWHLGDEAAYQPQNRGFDETFVHGAGGIGQAYKCSNADVPKNKYFDPIIRHNGSFVQTKGFCTDVFFDAALGWINTKRGGDAPFFTYITTNAPHSPYIAPPKNTKRFTDLGFDAGTAGFYGMIENIDENMGRLMVKLTEWKLLESTVIIFLSDNGSAGNGIGNGVIGKLPDGTELKAWNAGMKGYKGSPEEGGVRVPFFIRWDGKFPAGRDIDLLAGQTDLLPTLAQIAGAKLPENQVEGRSLLPLIQNDEAAKTWPDRYLFTHVGRWPVHANPDEYIWKGAAVRNQRFRMVGTDELYDITADPGQTTNVIANHPKVAADMKLAFETFWKEARPLMVNEDVPMSETQPYHEWFREQKESKGIPDWEKPSF
jgi:arylsulfatase